jgi:hypothetical protein
MNNNNGGQNELLPQTHNTATSGNLVLQPRVVRFKDAPGYLGMDRNRFNEEVRPFVAEVPMGKQGVAFDRLDLDAWFEEYKNRNGRPGQPKGELTWDVKERQGSLKGPVSGISTKKPTDGAFAKAVKQIASKKRSAS